MTHYAARILSPAIRNGNNSKLPICPCYVRSASSLTSGYSKRLEMTPDESFQQLWGQALEDYFSSTKRSDEDKRVLGSTHNLDGLLARLLSDSQKFTGFREKHAKLRSVLNRIAQPVSLVSNLAAKAIADTPYAPASVVLGAIALLFRAAEGVTQVYDSIEELFDKLSAYGPRLEQYMLAPINEHLQKVVVRILVYLLEIITRAEQLVKDGRWKKYAGVLFFGGDNKIKKLFSNLDRLMDSEQRLVGALSYSTSLRVDVKTDLLLEETSMSLEGVQQIATTLGEMKAAMAGVSARTPFPLIPCKC